MENQGGWKFDLPYPPSVNGYWRAVLKGGKPCQILSQKGRQYRDQVRVACIMAGLNGLRISGRLAVAVELFPPDRRRRDLDNAMKALLDSLTHAGFWLDDSQIDSLHILRREKLKGGLARVQIQELDPTQDG